MDDKGVLCLDATTRIRFGLTGDGELIANMGTASGSSAVQLSNGRATIKVKPNNGKSIVSVKAAGIETAFLSLSNDSM